MIDTKVQTLLTLVTAGSYTKAAQILNLTQPAVSHHIRQLEQEFHIKIFYPSKKELRITPEGEILVKYARRAVAVNTAAHQAISDSLERVRHLAIGITQSAGESLLPQVLATYCGEHPDIHINIFTDTINNLYNRLKVYGLDIAIIEGSLSDENYSCVLLDTDYLCLVVSPEHPFARRGNVPLSELRKEKFILRPPGAGTRELFDTFLISHGLGNRSLNIIIEIDNVAVIKDLVSQNMGVSVIAHSACKDELSSRKLVMVPVENANMVREINMVYHRDYFIHLEVLNDLRNIYHEIFQ